MTDTHTLDDYHRALSEVATKGPVSIHVVSCKVHGIGRGLDMHDATELALEELVAQGRAERDMAGRYKARRPESPEPESPHPEAPGAERPAAYQCWHDSPHGDGSDDPCEFDSEEPASPHCAGCVCAPNPEASAPGSEDDDVDARIQAERGDQDCPDCCQRPWLCSCDESSDDDIPDVPEDMPSPSKTLDPDTIAPEDPALAWEMCMEKCGRALL
ncbi:MAG TPA: hypothetical protein VF382_05505, partial [Actinomycetota bacterium]